MTGVEAVIVRNYFFCHCERSEAIPWFNGDSEYLNLCLMGLRFAEHTITITLSNHPL